MNKTKKALILSCKAETYSDIVSKMGYYVHSAKSESDMFLNLREIKYDVLVLDAEFSEGFYGANIVSAAATMKTEGRPYLIAVSDIKSEHHHAYLKSLGADAVIYRETAENELAEKTAESIWIKETARETDKRLKVESRIFEILTLKGFSAKSKGTKYLSQAIADVLYTPELIKQLTKAVYPAVAERNSTTSAAVERNIRFAIGKLSDKTNAEFIKAEAVALKKADLLREVTDRQIV